MVLAERNPENVRNGKRSRGPSPNGHASEDSSIEEEAGVYIFTNDCLTTLLLSSKSFPRFLHMSFTFSNCFDILPFTV